MLSTLSMSVGPGLEVAPLGFGTWAWGNKLLWGVCLFSRQRIWRATHYRLLEELLVLMQPLALASFLGTISEQQNGSSTGPTSATVLSLAIFMFILHVARCLVRHHFEIGELLDMHLVPALPRCPLHVSWNQTFGTRFATMPPQCFL